jgi:hypothetical protein
MNESEGQAVALSRPERFGEPFGKAGVQRAKPGTLPEGQEAALGRPERFGETFEKAGVQGALPPAGVRGVPEKHFFLLFRAAVGGARGKVELGDTPNLARELPAPLKLTPKWCVR